MLAAARGLIPVGPAEPRAPEPQSEEQPSYDQILEMRAVHDKNLRFREQSLADSLRQLRLDQQKLSDERSRYLAERANYEEQLAAARKAATSAGREEVRTILQTLKPKQAKEMLAQMLEEKGVADVVSLLSGMTDAKRAKILGEFKTPEENAKIKEVLRLIEQGGPEAGLADKAQQRLQQPPQGTPP